MAALTKTAILHGDNPSSGRVDWESCLKLPSLGQAFERGVHTCISVACRFAHA